MTELFLSILNMSVTAGLVIAVILAARAALYRAPRKYSLILWVLALFRLVCPVSPSSILSLFGVGGGASPVVVDAGAMSYRGFELGAPPDAGGTLEMETANTVTNAVSTVDAASATATATGAAEALSLTVTQILAIIWVIGALAMLVYGALSYIQIKRRVATAVRLGGNVFESDAIRSPFVLGFLKPRIYLPFGLADTTRGFILAHERHHIVRRDHITKLLAFIALAVHWFNPLVWLAFLLFSKDMEMSCDEYVLRAAEPGAKREYSLSMLSVAVNRRFPVPSPVAFGESGVRGRIKNALRFRRPKRWVTVTSALLCVLIAASCATNPLMPPSPSAPPPVISGTEIPNYYPDHTDPNEADYKTILADPSLFKEGKAVLAVWESTVTWSDRTYDESSKGYPPYGFDMRSCDMTGIDITSITDYNKITFDTDTIWPKKLPDGFDPKRFLELGKNPGLGINDLHKQGITGEGVGIAIIGGALPSGHEAYSSNLRWYECIHSLDGTSGTSGAWMAGTVVGQDTGVAPGADLYYIATRQYHLDADNSVRDYDMTILADCILRVLEINQELPESRKIRVIAVNGSYNLALTQYADEEGADAVRDALAQAERENILVLSPDTDDYYKDFQLAGAGCTDYLSDPDAFDSYQLSEQLFPTSSIMVGHINKLDSNLIIVPSWGHTLPGATGETDYMLTHFEYPALTPSWMAGFYALCCQVKPELTIREFIDVIQKTGAPHKEYVGKNPMDYGKMINPAGVIAELKKQ